MEKLEHMKPSIVEHEELKLVGIPCVSLKEMKSKFENAKESLLTVAKHLPHIINERIHYGIWPVSESQDNPETHVYILCVEVESFKNIPDWLIKITLPKQRCIVVANKDHSFDAAGEALYSYIESNNIELSSLGLQYRICERYNYDGEGYTRYTLPVVS
ncbi:GyrI-like domain-containing protein [Cytobacillus sp. Hm23]